VSTTTNQTQYNNTKRPRNAHVRSTPANTQGETRSTEVLAPAPCHRVNWGPARRGKLGQEHQLQVPVCKQQHNMQSTNETSVSCHNASVEERSLPEAIHSPHTAQTHNDGGRRHVPKAVHDDGAQPDRKRPAAGWDGCHDGNVDTRGGGEKEQDAQAKKQEEDPSGCKPPSEDT